MGLKLIFFAEVVHHCIEMKHHEETIVELLKYLIRIHGLQNMVKETKIRIRSAPTEEDHLK
jgi:hypothetical protein